MINNLQLNIINSPRKTLSGFVLNRLIRLSKNRINVNINTAIDINANTITACNDS